MSSIKEGQHKRLAELLMRFGAILLIVAFVLLALIFYPAIREELHYAIYGRAKTSVHVGPGEVKPEEIVPASTDFGIVIPAINANAKVIANVDPYNEPAYQRALAKGVAHARKTATPDVNGNMFIFAHSSADFYTANLYNSVFYLLHKLKPDDPIFVLYKEEVYEYKVKEQKIVAGTDVKYLRNSGVGKTLTLMTCWPPGTTFQRYVVVAELNEQGENRDMLK